MGRFGKSQLSNLSLKGISLMLGFEQGTLETRRGAGCRESNPFSRGGALVLPGTGNVRLC
jgi:hypothetical protein